ncbi:MAG: hypothetical protein EZS28_048640, partial [Streblomastix strix]
EEKIRRSWMQKRERNRIVVFAWIVIINMPHLGLVIQPFVMQFGLLVERVDSKFVSLLLFRYLVVGVRILVFTVISSFEKMDQMVEQLGTGLVKSSIAIANQYTRSGIVAAIILTSIIKSVTCKNQLIPFWSSSSMKPKILDNNVSTDDEQAPSVSSSAHIDHNIKLLYPGRITDDGCVFCKLLCTVMFISARVMYTLQIVSQMLKNVHKLNFRVAVQSRFTIYISFPYCSLQRSCIFVSRSERTWSKANIGCTDGLLYLVVPFILPSL